MKGTHSIKLRSSICALLAVTTAMVIAQGNASDSVATVNGTPISSSDYYQRMEFLSDMGTLVGKQYVEATPGLLTLDRLITEQLLLQLAAKDGVSPTQAQVDQLERDALTTDPLVEKDWAQTGRPLSELLTTYKLEAARFNILTRGIIVTDQEVKGQYNGHPDQYTIPKRIHLKVIILSTPDKESQVDAALQSGKTFEDVAQSFSEDITKARGGDFGYIPEANLPTYFKTAIQGVKIGSTTAWGEGTSQDGRIFYFKALFADAAAGQVLPLDAALTESIRKSMMIDRGSKIHDVNKELTDLRAQSKIVITNPVFSEQYNKLEGTQKDKGK